MLDIKFIRENAEKIKWASQVKKIECDVDKLLELDAALVKLRQEIQNIQTEKNAAGKKISKASPEEKKQIIESMAQLKNREKDIQTQLDEMEPAYQSLLLQVPQIPSEDVPVGKDDTENVEIRKVGAIREFDFTPLDHVELGQKLNLLDIPRGVKLAGARSYFLTGNGALLHWAVIRFAVDFMVKRGYFPMYPPMIVREQVMRGTGYLPGGEEQAYMCERDNLYVAGTAEVPVTAYFSDEILNQADLPKKFVALSTCFRREAGTYGKDTAGIYRIHQFDKVEQVIVGRNDEQQSIELHEEILANSEGILQALGLPYRVMNVCTGDLGRGQVKKYDIETWMPSRNSYGETHSASRFYDFQARRLNLRYRDENGKIQFCHTLNNTVIASPRVLIAILELYQNADGTVTVPEVLRPYMGGMETLKRR
ncbi:MAG: serine--tRNA ligase [Phycisphaerae bacterium]|nr:serine--tRNA ligase [Phycisphaerae bacterium]